MNQVTKIREYLPQKGIAFRESNGELITHCIFGKCDADSRGNEAHLYFEAETGRYHCKKCGERGNLVTLTKHFGDSIEDIALNLRTSKKQKRNMKFDTELVKTCYQALPTHIRQYLNARGITDATIGSHKLGYGTFYKKWWITFPVKDINGNYVFLKLKRDPGDATNPDKGKVYPIGVTAQLYDWDTLKNASDSIMIVEGEPDKLLLTSLGIPAVTSTGGAETFKEEWVEEIEKGRKIYICYDNDESGKGGAKKVAKLLESTGNEIYIVTLPDEVGEKGDITDYFMKLKGNPNDLFGKYAKKFDGTEKAERIKKIEKPEREISFVEWRETIQENFPDLLFPAEIGLSIISQILIKDITNPFALVLIDVPSAGKTIVINFFSEIEDLTYASDKFTPASFVSNATNVRKQDLEKIDLLPRLQYKMFLVRDLATLFSKRDDDLNECLGLLTRVLDGEGLNTDSGVHGQRQYVGEYLFMLLAGSTPIPPRVWKMMGSLGSRLFFLNVNPREKSEEELAEQLTTLAYKEKEKLCRMATSGFLKTLWHMYPEGVDWNKTVDGQEDKLIITRCAKLLAKLRGVIDLWKDKWEDAGKYEYTVPIVEKPDRINQLFYNLCRGHALVHGRTQINQDDLRLIVELAIDSAPTIRARLLRKLLENNGMMQTHEVEIALKCSKPTAHKEMETLKISGVCYLTQESRGVVGEPEKTLHLAKDFQWFLGDECKKLRGIPLPPQQGTLADSL